MSNIIESFPILDTRYAKKGDQAGGGASANAIFVTESFTAQAGKFYAVDTTGQSPEVLPSLSVGGFTFTGLTWDQTGGVEFGISESGGFDYWTDGGTLYVYANSSDTKGAIAAYIEGNGLFTVTVDAPSEPAGTIEGFESLSGGTPVSYIPVIATLPPSPTEGAVVSFCDAQGSWGANWLRLDPGAKNIFGRAGVFIIKTPALRADCVYIDEERGWAIFTGLSVPTLVAAPALTGAETQYSTLSCSTGEWTNAPTEFRYQWQISDDGTTGWADIAGATAATFTVRVGDLAKFIRCGVVATSAAGDSSREFSAPTGAIAEITLLTGLMAHWKFNETSGTRYDSHGTAHLSDNNAVGSASGVLGNCADFNYGSYLSAASSLPQLTGRAASYAFWFKTKNDMTGGFPDFCLFADLTDAGGTSHPVAGFIAAGGGRPYGSILFNFAYSGGYVGAVSVNGYADLEWHLAVITCDGTELKLYVDGAEADIMADGGVPFDPATITGDFTPIERQNVNGYADGWASGEIYFESASLWNRALSLAEVVALYNGGAGLDYENF